MSIETRELLLNRPSLEMPETAENMMMIAAGISAVIMLYFVISISRKEKVIYPFFLLIGAVACTFHEPFVSLLGHFHYPEIGQRTAFVLLGIAIPIFHPIVAMSYMGSIVIWTFVKLEARQLKLRTWWYVFVISTLIALVFEPPMIYAGLWKYFGANQSLMLLGFPVVWSIANAAGLMTVGLLSHLIWSELLQRRSSWTLAFIVPLLLFACHVPIVSPVYIALNSTESVLLNNLAALLTGIFSISQVYLGGKLIKLRQSR